MMVLLANLWPGLAAALALGLLVGAVTGLPRDRLGLCIAGAIAAGLAVLGGVALLGLAPGRAGLWVESAALMLTVYLAGCLLGGAGRLVAAQE